MVTQLTPEEETKIRVKFDTEYEFLLERNAIPADVAVSRETIREATNQLTAAERRTLQSRLRDRLQQVEDLMDGERKRFEQPYVKHEDLVAGVHIPAYYERVSSKSQ